MDRIEILFIKLAGIHSNNELTSLVRRVKNNTWTRPLEKTTEGSIHSMMNLSKEDSAIITQKNTENGFIFDSIDKRWKPDDEAASKTKVLQEEKNLIKEKDLVRKKQFLEHKEKEANNPYNILPQAAKTKLVTNSPKYIEEIERKERQIEIGHPKSKDPVFMERLEFLKGEIEKLKYRKKDNPDYVPF